MVALLGTFAGCATQSVVKLSRPPIPLGDPDGLASAVTLSERAPYSGMEYGYYHGVVSPEFAPALSVDVLYPGCLAAETEEARAKLLAKHVSRNTAQAPVVHRETPGSYEVHTCRTCDPFPRAIGGCIRSSPKKRRWSDCCTTTPTRTSLPAQHRPKVDDAPGPEDDAARRVARTRFGPRSVLSRTLSSTRYQVFARSQG